MLKLNVYYSCPDKAEGSALIAANSVEEATDILVDYLKNNNHTVEGSESTRNQGHYVHKYDAIWSEPELEDFTVNIPEPKVLTLSCDAWNNVAPLI